MLDRSDDTPRRELLIGLAGIGASLAASIAHWYFDPLPNPDAIAYLLAAQTWLDAGYGAAAATYPAPAYSGLIAALHSVSGLDLLTSAHWLDAATLAGLTIAMQILCRAVGGGVRVQAIVVVATVLLPELNGYRSFLLRDFGYWTLATFALAALARFAVGPAARYAAAFCAAGAAAALFRVEAVALLLLTPAALLFVPERRRFAGALYAVLACVVLVAVVFAAAVPDAPLSQSLAYTVRKYATLIGQVPVRAHAQSVGFANEVLDPRFHDYAGFGVAGGLATMVVVHVAMAASLPLFGIAVVGVIRRPLLQHIEHRTRPILAVAFAIAVAGVAGALAALGIVQTRYAMSAAWLIVLIAAFVIDAAWTQSWGTASRRLVAAGVGLLLAYLVIEDGYGLTNSKHHYLRAADWLARHTPSDARIFSNDARLLYLAGRSVAWRDLDRRVALDPAPLDAERYDYVVLVEPRSGPATVPQVNPAELQDVARFESGKGDAIAIFRVVETTSLGGGAAP